MSVLLDRVREMREFIMDVEVDVCASEIEEASKIFCRLFIDDEFVGTCSLNTYYHYRHHPSPNGDHIRKCQQEHAVYSST